MITTIILLWFFLNGLWLDQSSFIATAIFDWVCFGIIFKEKKIYQKVIKEKVKNEPV